MSSFQIKKAVLLNFWRCLVYPIGGVIALVTLPIWLPLQLCRKRKSYDMKPI
jgi:hypothetical protein